MKKLILDGDKITSLSDVHDLFSTELEFPSFYGRNLDALYDCLTDVSEKTEITVRNFAKLEYELGKYAAIIVRVIKDACDVNENLSVDM